MISFDIFHVVLPANGNNVSLRHLYRPFLHFHTNYYLRLTSTMVTTKNDCCFQQRIIVLMQLFTGHTDIIGFHVNSECIIFIFLTLNSAFSTLNSMEIENSVQAA